MEEEKPPVSDARGVPDELINSPESSSSFDARSPKAKRTEYVQFGVLFCSLFLAGWNDGTTGPLLPRLQEVYHVKYTVVSVIFIFNCVGFMSGAVANLWISDSLGFGKLLALGVSCQVVAYAIMAPAPPFPVLVLGYFLNGFGIAFQDAQANGYVASLKYHAAAKMGLLHAVYGLGALVAPLAATSFAAARRWSFHFLVSLGLACLTLVLIVSVFRGRTQNQCLTEIEQAPSEDELAAHARHHTTEGNTFRKVLRLRAVHLLSIWGLIYVGVEVTMGGWMVTFIIDARGGGPSSGYVSSGFFGGLTLGRVALLWVNQKVGERQVVFVYSAIAIALDIVIWRVRSLIGDAVAVSLIGFVLGPMYPIAMNQAGRVLPPALLTGAIGWIASFGQAGGALLPFVTGALAGSAGITTLQPFLLAMMAVMVVLWALVPTHAPSVPTVEKTADK